MVPVLIPIRREKTVGKSMTVAEEEHLRASLVSALSGLTTGSGKRELGFRLLTFYLENWAGRLTNDVLNDYSLRWLTFLERVCAFRMVLNRKLGKVEGMLSAENARLIRSGLPYLEVGKEGLLHLHLMHWENGDLFPLNGEGKRRWTKFCEMAKAYLGASSVHRTSRKTVATDGQITAAGRRSCYRVLSYARKGGKPITIDDPLTEIGAVRKRKAEKLVDLELNVYRLREIRDRLDGWPLSNVRVRRIPSGESMRWQVWARLYRRAHGNIGAFPFYLTELDRAKEVLDLKSVEWGLFDPRGRIEVLRSRGLAGFDDASGVFAALYRHRKTPALSPLRDWLETADMEMMHGTYALAERKQRDIRLCQSDGRLVPLDCSESDTSSDVDRETFEEEDDDSVMMAQEI